MSAGRFGAGLLLVVSVVIVACRDELIAPAADGGLSGAIVDAAHSSGADHFYFLPPLVPMPVVGGTPDTTLAPVVRVCELSAGACDAVVAELAAARTEDAYHVNWHTPDHDLDPATDYRIEVLVAGTRLGYADVDVLSTGRELRNVRSGDVIALVDGRTLPVRFRVEIGAVSVVGTAGGAITSPDGGVTIDVPPGALTGDVGITVRPAQEPAGDPRVVSGAFYDFGPDGLTFDVPAQLTIRYDPQQVPAGVSEASLRVHHVVQGGLVEVLGGSVDTLAKTVSALVTHFSEFGPAQGGDVTWGLSTDAAIGGGYDLWVAPSGEVFAVGRGRSGSSFFTRALRFDGTEWQVDSLAPDVDLYGVWGIDATTVFAVGAGPGTDAGVVYRFDGSTWTPMLSSTTGDTVPTVGSESVWASAPDDVWVGDWNGSILRFDGASWRTQRPAPSGAENCFVADLIGSSPNEIWAILSCSRDSLLRFDGFSWTSDTVLPLGVRARRLSVDSTGVAYATGRGFVLRREGTSWVPLDLPGITLLGDTIWRPEDIAFTGVWGTSPVDLYVTGLVDVRDWAVIAHYDGNGWTWQFVPHPVQREPLQVSGAFAVMGTSVDEIWVVGLRGVLRGSR